MLVGNGFKVSYVPNTGYLISAFAGDQDDETALLCDGKYYILNGDFRSQYKDCKTKKQAIAVFEKYAGESKSSWSNDIE